MLGYVQGYARYFLVMLFLSLQGSNIALAAVVDADASRSETVTGATARETEIGRMLTQAAALPAAVTKDAKLQPYIGQHKLGSIDENVLFARQTTAYNPTCGYVSNNDNPYSAWTCPRADSVCVSTSTSGFGIFGCCFTSLDEPPVLSLCNALSTYTCVDYTASATSSVGSNTLQCVSSAPYCYPGTLIAEAGEYYTYECGSAIPAGVAQAITGATSVSGSVVTVTASPPQAVSASGSSFTTTSTAPTSATSTSSSTLSAVPIPSPSHTGAIAGGAVGGVAALALLVAAIWFCARKKSRASRARAEHMHGLSQPLFVGESRATAELAPSQNHLISEKPGVEAGTRQYELEGRGISGAELP